METDPLPVHAALLLPDIALSECLFGAIVRDTRGVTLTDRERTNYFPASPLVTVTWVIEGETRMADEGCDATHARQAEALPPVTLAGPRTGPFVSWNPGPVFAVSIGFYPDAWVRLTGSDPASIVDRTVAEVPSAITGLPQPDGSMTAAHMWDGFQSALLPHWSEARGEGAQSRYRSRLSDWSRALVVRSLMSGPGRTVRAVQRRLKRWSGQSRRTLDFFSRIERMHELAVRQEDTDPADLALEAGYADQSHMGRMVRKATGFSPVQLNELVKRDEAFWCYRLLGERF